MNDTKILRSVSLHCCAGSSDKTYDMLMILLNPIMVNTRGAIPNIQIVINYGRRTGTKKEIIKEFRSSNSASDWFTAQMNSKLHKGYVITSETSPKPKKKIIYKKAPTKITQQVVDQAQSILQIAQSL